MIAFLYQRSLIMRHSIYAYRHGKLLAFIKVPTVVGAQSGTLR